MREKSKGSGEWWIFISHNGKRKSKRVGRDQKKAIEAAKKIEATLVLGDFDIEKEATKTPSFEEYATIWLDTYIKPLRRESTYERYRDALRKHIFPTMGKKPLDEIKRSDIRDLPLSHQ